MDNKDFDPSDDNLESEGTSQRVLLSSPSYIALVDTLIIICTGFLTSAFFTQEQLSPYYLILLLLSASLTNISFYKLGLYQFQSLVRPKSNSSKIIANQFVLISSLLSLAFILQITNELSRLWIFIWFISYTSMLIAIRFYYVFLIEKWGKEGKFDRNIVIIGAEKHARDLIEIIEYRKQSWMHILGVYEDRLSRVPTKLGNNRVLGTIDDLIRYSEENRVDDIIVALPWLAENRIKEILKKLELSGADIHLSPDLVSINLAKKTSEYCGLPVLNFSENSF